MSTVTLLFFFFFNDTATTEIYTLSLHDALPISHRQAGAEGARARRARDPGRLQQGTGDLPLRPRHHAALLRRALRSEEHTSELQSPCNLVCRLLLEKKNTIRTTKFAYTVQHTVS